MSQIQIQQQYTRKDCVDYTIKFINANIFVGATGKYTAVINFNVVDTSSGISLEVLTITIEENEWNSFWSAVKTNGIKALFQTLKTKMSEVIPGTVGTVSDTN